MQFINVLSIAPDVRDWLADSCHPRILHVFDRACNVINERREVLSIVTQEIGNGPFNLVIEDDILFSDHLDAQSSISIRANQLTLGDLIINTGNAKLWSARPDWETLHINKYSIFNQLMSSRDFGLGLDTPFAHLPWRAVPGKPAQGYSTTSLASSLLITNYQSLLSTISTSIASADLPSCLTAAHGLAGLGRGLTPAGDDLILGALLAAWIIHPAKAAAVIGEELANAAAPLTTSLSAAWLRSAGGGEAGILWHDFFEALISADPVRIQEAMDQILAVGETSGADALAGFIGTVMRWAELAHSKIP